MRTHRTIGRTSSITLAAALAVGAGFVSGCGESESGSESEQSQAPAVDPGSAPTRNPLSLRGSASPSSPHVPTGVDADSPMVRVYGVTLEAPEGWVREVTTSSMRAAQFRVPPVEGGSEDATLVVFQNIGGSAEDNIVRWIGQVVDKPEPPVRETVETEGGLTISTVRMTGTYSVGSMMGGTGNPEPDSMFLGAVITGNDGPFPVFLRLVGPRATIEPQLDRWNALIESVAKAS